MAERELSGKVVVITGASSGFGIGAARKFAEKGASVVLAARRESLLDDVARECEQSGGRALVFPIDITQEVHVSQLAQSAVEEFGKIDVWVNNASAGAVGRFEDVPLADHINVIQTDLIGTLYGSYYAMRQFRRQGAGILINVASIVGKIPAPYFASYVAAKSGVIGLGASLRQELHEDKVDTIHVCTVLPTAFDTPFYEHAAQYNAHQSVAVPPAYDPKDVVEAIVNLATDPEDQVTVGSAATVSNIAHHLFPGLVESLMARQTHKAAFENNKPDDNSGNPRQPVAPGGATGARK